MKTEVTRIPASRIPPGTLYSLGDVGGGKFSLNTARIERGRLKIVRNEGKPAPPDPAGSRFERGTTSSSGRRAVFRYVEMRPAAPPAHFDAVSRYYLVSLKEGKTIPLKQEFGRGFSRLGFTGFSPLEQYLSYTWWVQKPEANYGGSGIYDAKSHQTWEQDGALLAVWSRSGQYLVFIRHTSKGKYLSRDRKEDGSFMQNYFARPLPEVLADFRFFRKDVRTLRDPGAERITLEEAVRLVGPWYRPLVSYSAKEEFNTYQGRDLDPNQIAPGNRGIALINSHDPWAGTWPPMPPEDSALVWTTQYLDASGRSPIYRPAPSLSPILSWSPDGERVYGITRNSSRPFLCFWVRTGKYAQVPLPEKIGASLAFIED